MPTQSIHETADGAMTFVQKSFLWIASINVGASAMSILDWIPRLAPAVSLVFVVWVGLLTVKERKRSIREADMRIAALNTQRKLSEEQSDGMRMRQASGSDDESR